MKTRVCALLVLSVGLCGCYKQEDSRIHLREGVRSDTLDSNIVTRTVESAWSGLTGRGVELQNARVFRNASDLLEVYVDIHNKSTKTQRFEYRVEWIDGDGVVLDSRATTWIPFSVMGKASAQFSAVAPSKDAETFRIDTREMR